MFQLRLFARLLDALTVPFWAIRWVYRIAWAPQPYDRMSEWTAMAQHTGGPYSEPCQQFLAAYPEDRELQRRAKLFTELYDAFTQEHP